MNEDLLHYLKVLKKYGKENNIPNVSETMGKFLNMLIGIHSPQRILEIGSANGYSTLWMAEAAREVGAVIYTIDHSKPTFQELQKNLAQMEFQHTVISHFGEATNVIEHFDTSLIFDFVFVDGEKARYLDFWNAIQSRLAKNAVVIFDDMLAFREKTKPFEDFLKELTGWQQVLLPIDHQDGILLMRKISSTPTSV